MNRQDVLLALIQYDKPQIVKILTNTTDEYFNMLTHVAMDIYDSCIQLFYATYDPIVYDRHGDKSGFNLYAANNMGYSNLIVDMTLEPENLLPYYSMKKNKVGQFVPGNVLKEDVRAKVLGSVMDGVRARKTSKNIKSKRVKFPMTWDAFYPNQYSKYNIWSSKSKTIDTILDDFIENVVNDTLDDFYTLLSKNI